MARIPSKCGKYACPPPLDVLFDVVVSVAVMAKAGGFIVAISAAVGPVDYTLLSVCPSVRLSIKLGSERRDC